MDTAKSCSPLSCHHQPWGWPFCKDRGAGNTPPDPLSSAGWSSAPLQGQPRRSAPIDDTQTRQMHAQMHETGVTEDQACMHPPPSAHCSLQQTESSKPLPRKAIPFFCSSSGSLGFSEACPQPAHTAWKKRWSNTSHYILHQHLPLAMASCLTPLLLGGHHPHSEYPFCSLCFPWGLPTINPSPCWHRSWAFWHQCQ